jgi:hypothetical protein
MLKLTPGKLVERPGKVNHQKNLSNRQADAFPGERHRPVSISSNL